MAEHPINIGILAHVDAGKTSLTERLLFDHGAITKLGNIDSGDTTTDSLELERQRGITIRAAVASFKVNETQINIIDTPGHPDFIAEVERSLSVIDGAVLVVSATDGVQAQTRVLMKTLLRLKIPTAIFINKIDQTTARGVELLDEIRKTLKVTLIPRNEIEALGSSNAKVAPISWDEESQRQQAAVILAENDLGLLESLTAGETPSCERLNVIHKAQVCQCLVVPVFFGSAVTGAGVSQLVQDLAVLRRELTIDPSDSHVRGRIFAIERGRRGEKVSYARLYSGVIRERDRLQFSRYEKMDASFSYETLVTSLEVVCPTSNGKADHRCDLTAGNIGRIIGNNPFKVGDYLGVMPAEREAMNFASPALEAIIRPLKASKVVELGAAIARLVEEDPLIRTRQVEGGAIAVQLYGEVQKEIISERLKREFGIEASFDQVRPVYFERPRGTGRALHEMDHRNASANRFFATIGLMVEPAGIGSGVVYDIGDQKGHLPMAFHRALEETVFDTLRQGLYGWEVKDCHVVLTRAGYASSVSTAADFRDLTPLILMEALKKSGTVVYEPSQSFELEVPMGLFGAVLNQLRSVGANVNKISDSDQVVIMEGCIPARNVQAFLGGLPSLAHGEGVWRAYPGEDQPVTGQIPTRERMDGNPLNRDEYMLHLSGRAVARRRPNLSP